MGKNEILEKKLILDFDYLDEMIDYAWTQAIKYRFDPVAGKIHDDYLQMIKKIKKQLDRE